MQTKATRIGDHDAWTHDEGHGAGTFVTFDALQLAPTDPPRKVHVLLPRGYSPYGRQWPAVWMFDGDTAFWPGGVGGKTWDVAGTLSRLRGKVDDLIVIAVCPVERDREYTHVDWSGGRFPWGGLAEHAAWLAGTLVPFLHGQLAIDPARVAIAGSSHGGLAAFWAATRHPEVFRMAGCLSPSFFSGLDPWLEPPSRAPLAQAPIVAGAAALLADRERRPRLWIDWGLKRDGGPHNTVVEAAAARRSAEMIDLLVHSFGYREQPFDAGTVPDAEADLFTHVDRIGGHDEDAWRYRFGLMARAFFPAAG